MLIKQLKGRLSLRRPVRVRPRLYGFNGVGGAYPRPLPMKLLEKTVFLLCERLTCSPGVSLFCESPN